MLGGTCSREILILRLRNLSKRCLLRFLSLNIKILFTGCAVRCFKDCNTKLDHAELLPYSIFCMAFDVSCTDVKFLGVGQGVSVMKAVLFRFVV